MVASRIDHDLANVLEPKVRQGCLLHHRSHQAPGQMSTPYPFLHNKGIDLANQRSNIRESGGTTPKNGSARFSAEQGNVDRGICRKDRGVTPLSQT